MTEGELLQLTTLGRTDVSEQQYLDIIQRKTAFLFSACCEVGAILGGASAPAQKALADYGMNLGMAFQLTDDLLDFTSTDDALGKGTGVDLLGGKVTLPLIYLLADEASPSSTSPREMVQTVMAQGSYATVMRNELHQAVLQSGAIERARARGDEYAAAARTSLGSLGDSEFCESLKAIPTYVLDRDR
jgi:octaprenyl-diphosphate synthase